jgi:stage II sporulation protein M
MRFPVLVEPAVRPYVVVVMCLFALTVALGTAAPPETAAFFISSFRAAFRPLRDLPHAQLFLTILAKNLSATFLTMMGGLLLGFPPILSVIGNGFVLGVFVRAASRTSGVIELVSRIAPHGVFELPAFWVAGAYGLWLGAGTLGLHRGREVGGIRGLVGHAARRYLRVVVPLLTVAAAIESTLIVKAR